jgi:hypothetical protein
MAVLDGPNANVHDAIESQFLVCNIQQLASHDPGRRGPPRRRGELAEGVPAVPQRQGRSASPPHRFGPISSS